MRVNRKKNPVSSVSAEVRDEQFVYIAEMRESFASRGAMIISVDSKKKELVGNFKNEGQAWSKQSIDVNDHDFRSQADGIAIPYGIYDLRSNRGSIFIGTSSDTPWFSTDCLALWYELEGQKRYPDTTELLILADGGGSNRVGSYAWKYGLQIKLCNHFGINITVCHYPPGTSKWNPIEHRLFSEISKNWAGRPLDSYDTMLNYIRTTKTSSGLKVSASLVKTCYEKGMKVSEEQIQELQNEKHTIQPKRNYTLHPKQVQTYILSGFNCQQLIKPR